MQEEKDLANQMGRRYKAALEKSRKLVTETSSEPNLEHLQNLIRSVHFPAPQPGIIGG